MPVKLATHLTSAFLGFLVAYNLLDPVPPPPSPPDTTVTLVAVLPERVRVYRIQSPALIVPAFVAVSPSGNASIR